MSTDVQKRSRGNPVTDWASTAELFGDSEFQSDLAEANRLPLGEVGIEDAASVYNAAKRVRDRLRDRAQVAGGPTGDLALTIDKLGALITSMKLVFDSYKGGSVSSGVLRIWGKVNDLSQKVVKRGRAVEAQVSRQTSNSTGVRTHIELAFARDSFANRWLGGRIRQDVVWEDGRPDVIEVTEDLIDTTEDYVAAASVYNGALAAPARLTAIAGSNSRRGNGKSAEYFSAHAAHANNSPALLEVSSLRDKLAQEWLTVFADFVGEYGGTPAEEFPLRELRTNGGSDDSDD
jgi:hypothetical protein